MTSHDCTTGSYREEMQSDHSLWWTAGSNRNELGGEEVRTDAREGNGRIILLQTKQKRAQMFVRKMSAGPQVSRDGISVLPIGEATHSSLRLWWYSAQ